ncbi:MAG: peptidylprolyl isomerase [Burkholderiaceae bacterium]
MIQRASVLTLACLSCWLALSAQAQGLRPSTQLGGGALRAPASATAGQRLADYIVAVVNSEPITNNEVRSRLVRVEQQLTQQGAALPSREELTRQVLERLISEKAQLQLARESGIRVEEGTVDQAEQSVARQNQMEVTELRRKLAAEGTPLSQFREELRNQVLLQRLRERELEPRVKVSDLDVDQFIREQQGRTDLATLEINLGHVLVLVPESASAAQITTLQARAQRVAERARAGEDFAALAREFSDAAEGRHGGQLGLRNAQRYPELFVESTLNLRVGDIVGPLRSAAGFHVLKVLEKQQAGLPGVTVTQSHARHILLRLGPQLSESAAIQRLADFKRRLQAGRADFAALARENSQDGSARDGGDLGWVNPGQFVPEFEEVMNGLSPGQVSEPLVSRFGVHLIQLLERRTATLSQREQRDLARNLVREKKLDEAYTTWAQEVRGRAYVEFREAPQ